MMKAIKKFLTDNNIDFEIRERFLEQPTIVITLERNCTWVNGYGKEMKYNKEISIFQDRYKKYVVKEITDYNRETTHISDGKQKTIVSRLEKLLA